MKRLCSIAILLVFILMCIPQITFARENYEYVYFEDGSYAVITIHETALRALNSKNGSRVYTYYNSDGVAQWKAVLSATFTYNGSTSTCTSSGCNVTVFNSDWYTVSKTAGKSGNSSTADVTMGKKLLGITVSKKTVHLSLSCDANGNLS